MSEPIIINTCPRGGFFDGNENFGGPPYRGFMALLCFAPTIFFILSASWWFINYYRERQSASASRIQNGNIVSEQSNYQTMNDNTQSSSSSSSISSSSSSSDANSEEHPTIDFSLYYDSEPSSPYSSSSIGPLASPSPQPSLPSTSSVMSPSSISTSLLASPSPSPDSSSNSSSFNVDDNNRRPISRVARKTQLLLFLRSLIRPKPLFASTFVLSTIQFIVTLGTIIYAIISGEQCCYGGTGALYAILCLRLCLSYTNLRVGYWQTNSRVNNISVVDKSCQIGYLIHYIWLSFAFILVSDDGQCSSTAPVMYTVSFISIILLLINYFIFSIFTALSYIYHSKNDLMIVLSRTCIKFCLIGWSYGKELDLNDAITDIEMEIACLPCITYNEMVIREKEKKRRKEMYEAEKKPITVKVDNMNNNEQINNNDKKDDEIETLSCAICLSAYEESDMIRPLPCGHHLHKSCSDSWLKVKSTCPLCVRSVLVQ